MKLDTYLGGLESSFNNCVNLKKKKLNNWVVERGGWPFIFFILVVSSKH